MLVTLNEPIKEQMADAAAQTNKAYLAARKGRDSESMEGSRAAGMEEGGSSIVTANGTYLAPEIVIMQPILRFLQLLCENHNADMQVWGIGITN